MITPPLPSCPNGKIAELLNVYTIEEYRRHGYAERLLRLLIEELKTRDVGKIILEYTDAGFPVYQKLGFVVTENHMKLNL